MRVPESPAAEAPHSAGTGATPNADHVPADDGLRRLLTWTLVALVCAVALAVGLVWVVTSLFDTPR
jgi:hypothetical protein